MQCVGPPVTLYFMLSSSFVLFYALVATRTYGCAAYFDQGRLVKISFLAIVLITQIPSHKCEFSQEEERQVLE